MKLEQIERLNIKNYTVNSYFCREKSNKGGVLIMSKRQMEWKQVAIHNVDMLCTEKVFEFCATKFVVNGLSFVLVGLYRSPSSDVGIFLDRLDILINIVNKISSKLIFAGDINLNVLVSSREHTNLRNLLKSHKMFYVVDFPTRVQGGSVSSIDNFLTNFNRNQIKIDGIITMLSDHDGQVLEIHLNGVNKTKENLFLNENRRNFSQPNKTLFKNLLKNESWHEVYMAPTEKKFTVFNNIFYYNFNLAFPKVNFKIKNKHFNWITDQLRNEKQEIIQLCKCARETKNLNLSKIAKVKNKIYRTKLAKTKREYFDRQMQKSCNLAKTTWNIINSEVGNKSSNFQANIVLSENNKEVINPIEITNIFNNYFVNSVNLKKDECSLMYKENIEHFSHLNKIDLLEQNLHLSPTNIKEVIEIISSFKNSSSSGYDEVPLKLFKFVSGELSQVLVHLINSSLVCGKFPDFLKISKVIPIHKKNDKKSKKNYRPISLLPSISKIYEKIVYRRLLSFLENNKKLDSNQHGYRKEKSTISAAVQFIDSIINSIDKEDTVIGVFMDLSKAFDSVNHPLLLFILKEVGVRGVALQWFESYITGRKQFVEISHITKTNTIVKYRSKLQNIELGVPQGSNLGPLLFLCYLKHVNSCLEFSPMSSLVLYADDANLKISHKSQTQLETIANTELDNINYFFKSRNLSLNLEKTNYVHFRTKQNRKQVNLSIEIEQVQIDKINSIKFLGLLIDTNLNWNLHVDHILKKVSSGLFALKKMSSLCSTDILKQIYYAYIHSHIKYGICLYGATSNNNMNEILKLQKRALRLMIHLKFTESVKKFFSELKILTVFGLYIFETIMLFKSSQIIKQQDSQHKYNTRNKQNLVSECHRLQLFKQKPIYAGNKFMGKLPVQLKNEKNVQKFKKLLKEHLTHLALYSIEEFENI